MISKAEKNRIIRLKRQANYMRARSESDELTSKQRTHAMATAGAISWAIGMAINVLETREKERVHDSLIDQAMKFLRARKYARNRKRFEQAEQFARDLYKADVMDHEKTYEGLATQLERNAAQKDSGK